MISKYSDHNFHHWIRLIQQTKSNHALSFPFLSIFFFYDIHSLHFFFFLFSLSIWFTSPLLSLCTSLSISIKYSSQFISSSPPQPPAFMFVTTTLFCYVVFTSLSLSHSSLSRSSPSPQVTSLSVSVCVSIASPLIFLSSPLIGFVFLYRSEKEQWQNRKEK